MWIQGDVLCKDEVIRRSHITAEQIECTTKEGDILTDQMYYQGVM